MEDYNNRFRNTIGRVSSSKLFFDNLYPSNQSIDNHRITQKLDKQATEFEYRNLSQLSRTNPDHFGWYRKQQEYTKVFPQSPSSKVQTLRKTSDSKMSISHLLSKDFLPDIKVETNSNDKLYQSRMEWNQSFYYPNPKTTLNNHNSTKLYESFVLNQSSSYQPDIKQVKNQKQYLSPSIKNRKYMRSPQMYESKMCASSTYSQKNFENQKNDEDNLLGKTYSPKRVNDIVEKFNKLKSSQIENDRKQLWKKYDTYVKSECKLKESSKLNDDHEATNHNSSHQKSLQESHSATFLSEISKVSRYEMRPNIQQTDFKKKQFLLDTTLTPKYIKKLSLNEQKRYTNLPKMEGALVSSPKISKNEEKLQAQQNLNKFQNPLKISDFKVGPQKGEGKFGSVYICIHKLTNTIYALKKISKKLIKSHKIQDQLIKEIKLQSFFQNEHIVKLYSFFDDKDFVYLLLEYMEEGTLFDQLKKNKPGQIVQERLIARKIYEITNAVTYIHDLNVAHRDIKPENIVLTNGVAKLCDFGWATSCNDRRKTFCGTFDYMPPDILQQKQYDEKVDLWCLGVLTYEMLTGQVPFYHNSRKETTRRILSIDKQKIKYPSTISKQAKNFIECLLKKQASQRREASSLCNHPFLNKYIQRENYLKQF